MYGGRARLGLIVPSTNSVVEPEFQHYAPVGVSTLATRVPVAEARDESEKVATIVAMRDRIPAAAAELSDVRPNVVAYACTSGSFLEGRDSDEKTCCELVAITGVPSLTTSTAVVAALRSVRAKKIAVITPYIESVAAGARAYLDQHGFDVVAHSDLGLLSNLEKGRLPADACSRLARGTNLADADAVLICCTNWRSLDVVAKLERDLGRPVISSNLSTLWASLVLAGIASDRRPGVQLMECAGEQLPEYVVPAS